MNDTTHMALMGYGTYLQEEERSANTVAKYLRDIGAFFDFLGDRPLCKEALLTWKEQLLETHARSSVNSMLAAVNGFLKWSGRPELLVKQLKIQTSTFARPETELTRAEYIRLVQTAERGRHGRLALLLQTMCGTGVRVSELRFVTVEAVRAGRATVDCKGKTRTVFLPRDLCRMLKRYCRVQGIEGGLVFRTKSGKALDRTNIWREMKALCKAAGVAPGKVFPHNLRHLFARTYYQLEKDLSRLADLLGHTSVSTTRIYTRESGVRHARQLERMGLVFALE